MTDRSDVATLVPTKSDAERAREFRAKFEELLLPICHLADEAKEAGLMVKFSIGLDYLGRNIITGLMFIKEL